MTWAGAVVAGLAVMLALVLGMLLGIVLSAIGQQHAQQKASVTNTPTINYYRGRAHASWPSGAATGM